jgi:ligand-binding sensor domain-containing protein
MMTGLQILVHLCISGGFSAMKKCAKKFLCGVVLGLVWAGGCAQPLPPAVDVPPSAVRCYTATQEIRDIAAAGPQIVWSATPGGLLKLDRHSKQWTVLTVASGLPSNNITALHYSAAGILWIGTDRGVCQLNRNGRINADPRAGLPSPIITALAESGDGVLYAGTERGIARYAAKTGWQPVSDSHEFARRRVRDMARDTDGSMWFVKENALSHYRADGVWEIFHKDILLTNPRAGFPAVNLLSIAIDRTGTKWLGTVNGLSRYAGASWQNVYNRERIAIQNGLKSNWIERLAAGPGNTIWVAHGNSGGGRTPTGVGCRGETDEWTYITEADGLPSNRVYSVRPGADNDLWAGTGRGLARIANGQAEPFIPPSCLADNHVLAVLTDEAGEVYALLPRQMTAYDAASGILQTYQLPHAIRAGIKMHGTVYIAGMDRGLSVFQKPAQWREDRFFRHKTVLHVEKAEDEKLFAVCREGLYLGTEEAWSAVTLPALPLQTHLLRAFRSPQGAIWFTGEHGLHNTEKRAVCFLYSGDRLLQIDVPPLCRQYSPFNHIIFDAQGTPWLVSPAGIYQYQQSWQELSTPLPRGSTYAAFWDERNWLWTGSRDGGLFVYDGHSWRELRLNNHPVPGWITSVRTSKTNQLWIGTADQGIFQIDLKGIL